MKKSPATNIYSEERTSEFLVSQVRYNIQSAYSSKLRKETLQFLFALRFLRFLSSYDEIYKITKYIYFASNGHCKCIANNGSAANIAAALFCFVLKMLYVNLDKGASIESNNIINHKLRKMILKFFPNNRNVNPFLVSLYKKK